MHKGEIRDCHVDKRLKQVWIEPRDFVTAATAGGAATGATLTCGYTNGDVMPPALWNVGSFRSGLYGVRIASTAATPYSRLACSVKIWYEMYT